MSIPCVFEGVHQFGRLFPSFLRTSPQKGPISGTLIIRIAFFLKRAFLKTANVLNMILEENNAPLRVAKGFSQQKHCHRGKGKTYVSGKGPRLAWAVWNGGSHPDL
ncbi:MAG: hypothetical protein IK129_01895 [Deltaproteobacteria bacterium]|nr:hypothetical protein [Deltaproteobacteria bacterium]